MRVNESEAKQVIKSHVMSDSLFTTYHFDQSQRNGGKAENRNPGSRQSMQEP